MIQSVDITQERILGFDDYGLYLNELCPYVGMQPKAGEGA